MTNLLSDRGRWGKITLLVGVFLILCWYYQWTAPNIGADWELALTAQLGPPGQAYDLYRRPVLRLIKGGFVVGAGRPMVEVTCLSRAKVRPGDWVDLAGRWLGGTVIRVTGLHVHQGPRAAKLIISLAAALVALGLVAARFKPVAWRLVPRSRPAKGRAGD